jgi:FAD/FMN-containing dehydrogenase
MGEIMELKELQGRIQGDVTNFGDASYENLRRALVWNQLVPERHPRIIVEAASDNDVVEAVRFARANRMKIAVRGGGHSWVGFSLRDDSLLIDLGRLNEVSIDPQARRAVVGPTVIGREFNRQLAAHGLAFPVGHCPTVPLSGFLLNGGLGWNFGGWGPACFSIESADVVTADGNLVTTSEAEHTDLLWAVRGGGPGFFGVVTKYHLKLFAALHAITTTNYYFALPQAERAGTWARSIANLLAKHVELTILFAPAPPPLAPRCASANGFVCIVSATAFVDTAGEAAAALEPVNNCPISSDCLQKELNLSTPLEALLEMGGALWPEHHRYLADTLWTNSPPARVFATLRDHFRRAPSAKSQTAFVLSTGKERDSSSLPDGAYSMTGDALMLCYAIWERPEDDAANGAWHRAMTADLDNFAVGHYVGESDIVADPRRAERSYAKANWERLQALRRNYDPDGLFHGHFGVS